MPQRKLSITTSFLVLTYTDAFWSMPGHVPVVRSKPSFLGMVPPDAPAGSFFHKVPEEGERTPGNGAPQPSFEDLNDEVTELLRQRRKPPRASKPSTIGGVPTAKATGFGKNPVTKPSSKNFIGIGPQDPLINDPTKPEFDDQGYTLYTDNTTGKKSRVFEALVDYPCDFTMKIVGANEGLFVEEIVAVVAEACESEPGLISYQTRAVGKWTSVTVQAPVKSSEMLYTLYEKIDLDPRVKFKF